MTETARARAMIATARAVVSFTGAGLSDESGVATFRDPRTGLWARYDPATLASPEGFEADPKLVMDWYAFRRKAIAAATPNAAHTALAARADFTHVTQNVDDLLERAGAPNAIHLHGTITHDKCHAGCGHDEPIDLADPPGLRDCPHCGDARMRPSVVWFGEALPTDAWEDAAGHCADCDVLLVVGTSAVVYPAAGLITVAKQAGAEVIVVNTQSSDASGLADVELLGPAGEIVPEIV